MATLLSFVGCQKDSDFLDTSFSGLFMTKLR